MSWSWCCNALAAQVRRPVRHAATSFSVAFVAFLLVSGAFRADLRAQFDANLGRIVGTVTGPTTS